MSRRKDPRFSTSKSRKALYDKISAYREDILIHNLHYKKYEPVLPSQNYCSPPKLKEYRKSVDRRCNVSWANKKYIKLFYLLAKEEGKRTGRDVQVDHIVPLKSDVVCGLHNEFNLQLLFKEDNISKSNRFSL